MGYTEMTKQDMAVQKQLLQQYQEALKTLPTGRLTCKRKQNHLYYYRITPTGQQIYIQTRDAHLVHQLKYRKFLEEAVKRMEKNIRAQEKLLQDYAPYDPQTIQQSLPKGYADLILSDSSHPQSPKSQNSPYYKNGLTHATSFGLYVRSKSEVIIAELLRSFEVPFQYESALQLQSMDGRFLTYHPDFAISPPLGQPIYWEHAGLFNQDSYRSKFLNKIAVYHHNHIVIPTNLIITMDAPDGTIDVAAIHRIIEGQILPLFR